MIKSSVFLSIVLLLITLAAVGYQAYELNKVRQQKLAVPAKRSEAAQAKPLNAVNKLPSLADLAKENLMGNPAKPVVKEVKQDKILDTTLRLTLVGTITTTGQGKSSALIQGNNHEAKRYFVGEMLEGGATLESVGVESVTLRRNGQLETLHYPVSNTGVNTPPAANQPVTQQINPAAGRAPAPINPAAANAVQRIMSERDKKIMSLRARLRQNQNQPQVPQNSGTQGNH